jgi:hypothetical protein
MRNLYNVHQRYFQLLAEIEDNEGELDEDSENSLKLTQESYEKGMVQHSEAVKDFTMQVNEAKSEIERLRAFISPKENAIKRIKQSMSDSILLFGTKDSKKEIWRTEVGTNKFGTNRSVVTLVEEDVIADKWKRLSIGELSLEDKVKILDAIGKSENDVKLFVDIPLSPIKKAIDAGEEVEGASLKTKYNISIK